MDTHREHAKHEAGAPVGPVAGETLKDPAGWPGHVLIAVGLLAVALSLTGFAVGRGGFATAGVVVAVLALSAGVGWLVAEHRRLRARTATITPERPEDVAPPR